MPTMKPFTRTPICRAVNKIIILWLQKHVGPDEFESIAVEYGMPNTLAPAAARSIHRFLLCSGKVMSQGAQNQIHDWMLDFCTYVDVRCDRSQKVP